MTAVLARVTETGGREATTRRIPPKLALAVGMPSTSPPKGWQWSALTSLARLESGHTPSRQHPEYWGGSIPWLGIADAKAHDGQRIDDTLEHTNELGIENSSARVLPANTVCLSRTASVGYVVVMGRPMATSQDFVNWVCSPNLDHNFLKYLFIAEGDDLLRFSSGAVHQTIYFPEVKAFYICHPPLPDQQRIVSNLDQALDDIATAKSNAEKNLQNGRALYESYLHSIFTHRGPGWMDVPLGELCDILDSERKPITKRDRISGEIPYYGATGIQDYVDGFIFDEPLVLVGEDGAKWGAGERTAFAVSGKCWVNNHAHVLRPRRRALLDYWLISFLNHSDLKEFVSGLTVPKLNQGNLREIPIPLPPLKIQKTLANNAETLELETQRLESIYRQKLTALDVLRKSLLHQAFSGQL